MADNGKTSFRSARGRAQLNRGAFFRKAFMVTVIVVAILAFVVVRHSMAPTQKNTGQAPAASPSTPAPSTFRYYDQTQEDTYETGNGYVVITRSDNSRIKVDRDGNVWYIADDGTEIPLSGDLAKETLERMLALMNTDYSVRAALGADFGKTTEAEPQAVVETEPTETNEEITARILDEYGLTLDDFYKKLYENDVTPSEYYEQMEQGKDPKLLIDAALSLGNDVAENEPEGMTTDFGKVEIVEEETTEEEEEPDWLTLDPMESMTAALNSLGSISAGAATETESNWNLVNQNTAKQNWYDAQQASGQVTQTARLTDRDVAPGTVIPITLLTGLDTDLPGEVIGLVRSDIYDTLTGRNVLIPKGSRVMAAYNNSVSFGQRSVQIAWNQLITPDGRVYSLPGFNGTTLDGYSGVKDKYTDHFWEILGGAILGSIVDYGAGYVKEQADAASAIAGTELISALTGQTVDVSQSYVDKYTNLAMSRQPTIKIRTGQQLNMLVNRIFTVD